MDAHAIMVVPPRVVASARPAAVPSAVVVAIANAPRARASAAELGMNDS